MIRRHPPIRASGRYLRLHLGTKTVGLLQLRPDPVELAPPHLEAALWCSNRTIMVRLRQTSTRHGGENGKDGLEITREPDFSA